MQDRGRAARRPRIVLGVTGSVAAIKVPLLCQLLVAFADVKVVCTTAARYFVTNDQLPQECQPILGDDDEWHEWRRVGDPVMHIELRRWADVLLLAPLSANTLAKLAGGLCDNLATCVARAWDFADPFLVAPAMNTFMWDSPFTAQHLQVLERLGVQAVPPVSKRLACGDIGAGAMASPEDIAAACIHALRSRGFACPDLQPHPPHGTLGVAAAGDGTALPADQEVDDTALEQNLLQNGL